MDWTMRGQIPSFGNWDLYGELPVTQCFDTVRQPGVFRRQFFMEDGDLDFFKVPASPLPSYHYQKPRRMMEERNHRRSVAGLKDVQLRKPTRKVFDETLNKQDQQLHRHREQQRRSRAPKAVDEDLYKIPPEFLYPKPKRRVTMCDFWKRCLGLNCIP